MRRLKRLLDTTPITRRFTASPAMTRAAWKLAPTTRDGQWVTFAGGEGEEPFPHLSHALAREVQCDRCHVEVLPGMYK